MPLSPERSRFRKSSRCLSTLEWSIITSITSQGKTYYSGEGAAVCTPIPLEGLPPVAADFDTEALRANILDSQHHGQSSRDFSIRGVQGYFAFLRGQRATYFGRQGDQHTERFPGAKP